MRPDPVDCVILAAGNSSRLGLNKQLLRFGGETLIRRAVRTARAAAVRNVAVVLGSNPEAIRAEIDGLGAEEVMNPQWSTGMGSSLAAGVDAPAVRAWDSAALLVVLPDQYLVTAAHLDALIAARAATKKGIAATRYGDDIGAPAVFGAAYFRALSALAPSAGARPLLKTYASDVHLVDNADAAIDLDTRADLERPGAPEL